MEDAPAALAGNTPGGRMRPPGARGCRPTPLLAVLLAVLAGMLTACGGQGDPASGSGTAPQASGAQGSRAPGQADASSESSQSGAVAFAQCVRSHGVPDFPDPQNGHFLISGADQNNPNFNSAVQTCQHLLGPGGATNGGGPNNSALLKFAHCMQTHGVPQFPDPTSNGAIGLPSGVDPNTPQFQKAWQECQSKLPGTLRGQQP